MAGGAVAESEGARAVVAAPPRVERKQATSGPPSSAPTTAPPASPPGAGSVGAGARPEAAPEVHAAALSGGRVRAAGAVSGLQRQYGNRYAQRVLAAAGPLAAPRMVLGPSHDRFEAEADLIATAVTGLVAPTSSVPSVPRGALVVSRLAPAPARIQAAPGPTRRGGGDAGDDVARRICERLGRGDALPDDVRRTMEPRLGADLGAVRVHSDGHAAALNHVLGAHAFTTGRDIFFGGGRYAPAQPAGRWLLAHELTHVVQQRGLERPSLQLYVQRQTISGTARELLLRPVVQSGLEAGATYGLTVALQKLAVYLATLAGTSGADLAAYVGIAKEVLALAKAAAAIWSEIPPGYQVLLAYMIGSCIYLITPTKLFKESLFVTDGRSPTLELLQGAISQLDVALGGLKTVGKKLVAVPAWMAKKFATFVTDRIWGPEQKAPPSAPQPAALPASPAPAPKGPLKTLEFGILKLTLHEMRTTAAREADAPEAASEQVDEKAPVAPKSRLPGGLLFRTGVEVSLFGRAFHYGNDPSKSADIVVPWGFRRPKLHLKDAFRYAGPLDVGLFKISGVSAENLVIGDEGLESGVFKVDRLALLDDVFVARDAVAVYRPGGLSFAGAFAFDLMGQRAGGSATLELDRDGKFVAGAVTGLDAGKRLKWARAEFTPDRLQFTEAEVMLPEFLDHRMVAFPTVTITRDSLTGRARVTPFDLRLIPGVLTVKEVKISGGVDRDGWDLEVEGDAKFDLPNVDAKARFDGHYLRKKGEESKFDGGLSVEAGFDLTLGTFTLRVERCSFDTRTRTLAIDHAKLDLTQGITADVTGVRVGPGGKVALEQAEVRRAGKFDLIPGTRLIAFDGLTAGITATDDDRYRITGKTTVLVDLPQPRVAGKIAGAVLTYDEKGVSGSFEAFELTTDLFAIGAAGGTFDQDGIRRIETAWLKLGGADEKTDASAFGLDLGRVGAAALQKARGLKVKAGGVSLRRGQGLKIESFSPGIPRMSVNLFGGAVQGEIDAEAFAGKLGVDFAFPSARLGVPGWPFSLSVAFPFLGALQFKAQLSVYGGLRVGGQLEAKNPARDIRTPWDLSGALDFAGKLGLKASVGIGLGSDYLVAVNAELFLATEADFGGTGQVAGKAMCDPATLSLTRAPDSSREIEYDVRGKFVARVGAQLQAKVLYFFEKQLYEVTLKEWDLGHFAVGKRVVEGPDGQCKVDAQQSWGFLDNGKKPGWPRPPAEVLPAPKQIGDADEYLKASKEHIVGSGPRRRELLQQVQRKYHSGIEAARLQERKYLDRLNRGKGSPAERERWMQKLSNYSKEIDRALKVASAIQWAINDPSILERGWVSVADRAREADDQARAVGTAQYALEASLSGQAASPRSSQPATVAPARESKSAPVTASSSSQPATVDAKSATRPVPRPRAASPRRAKSPPLRPPRPSAQALAQFLAQERSQALATPSTATAAPEAAPVEPTPQPTPPRALAPTPRAAATSEQMPEHEPTVATASSEVEAPPVVASPSVLVAPAPVDGRRSRFPDDDEISSEDAAPARPAETEAAEPVPSRMRWLADWFDYYMSFRG
jgi:hypothetical protein